MSIASSLIRAAADFLELEVAILSTDMNIFGETKEEKIEKILDTHARAYDRFKQRVPSGLDVNTVLTLAKDEVKRRENNRAISFKMRKRLQKEREAERQLMLSGL